jgi:hypothetical protein
MESKIFMKPIDKNKLSSHIHHAHEVVHEVVSRNRQGSDRRRSRAASGLADNISRQNKLSLGVNVRKMSVVIDRPLSFCVDISRLRKAVRSVMSLLRLVNQLRSRNSHLVKISLLRLMNLLQAPQNAGIMNDVGACRALLELLNLDLAHHWQIVGLAMHGIKLLALSPECSLAFCSQESFCPLIEKSLRSDTAVTQKLAGDIVHRCFVQPLQHETTIVNDDGMMGLLFKALRLPYPEIQVKLLRLIEDLTYHCANTSRLCSHSEGSSGLVLILLEIIGEGFNTEGDAR